MHEPLFAAPEAGEAVSRELLERSDCVKREGRADICGWSTEQPPVFCGGRAGRSCVPSIVEAEG